MGALGRDLFAVIRYTDAEVVLMLVNRADAEGVAVFYPALLYEGADGDAPVAFSGTYTAENGDRFTANASLRVSVPPCGYRILTKS